MSLLPFCSKGYSTFKLINKLKSHGNAFFYLFVLERLKNKGLHRSEDRVKREKKNVFLFLNYNTYCLYILILIYMKIIILILV